MQVDADFTNKFGDTNKATKKISKQNYNDWFHKSINLVAEAMPNRVDLILPFLSYAVIKKKRNDAVEYMSEKNCLENRRFSTLL